MIPTWWGGSGEESRDTGLLAEHGDHLLRAVPQGSEPTTLLPLRFLSRWAAQRRGLAEPIPMLTSLLDLNAASRALLEDALGYDLEVAAGTHGLGQAIGREPSGMERLIGQNMGVGYTAERGSGLCLFRIQGERVIFDPQSTALPRHPSDLLGTQPGSPRRQTWQPTMALVVDRFVRGNMYHEVCDHLLRAYCQQRACQQRAGRHHQDGFCVTQADDNPTLAFAATAWPYSRFLIHRLIEQPVAYLKPGLIYSCETLLYWSNMARVQSPGCSRDPAYLQSLRGAVAEPISPAAADAGRTALRLYISRQNSAARRIEQEHELAEALADEGFHVVCMETLSPEQQIQLVRSASLIIAPHGAALTNLLFASSRCRVVELLPEPRAHYATLCQALNLPYQGVKLTQAEGKGGKAIAKELLEAAWRLNLEQGT